MKKHVFSFTNFWVTLVSFIILIAALVLYFITGLQIASANAKRSDLVKYSSLYASSFAYSQSELKAFAETADGEHYIKYSDTVADSGDFSVSRKMLDSIGLTKAEKEILKEFDSSYKDHIEAVNKQASEAALKNSDYNAAKSALSAKDYIDYSSYGYVCLDTLSDTIYNRMTDTLNSLDLRQNIISVCVLVLALLFAVLTFFTYKRIKALASMIKDDFLDSDNDQNDQE